MNPEGEASDRRLPKTADADHTEPAAPEQSRSVKSSVNNTQKQANFYVHGRGNGQNRGPSTRPYH
jgi:hypothetical protein